MEIIQDVVEGEGINQFMSSQETVLADTVVFKKKLVVPWLYPMLV